MKTGCGTVGNGEAERRPHSDYCPWILAATLFAGALFISAPAAVALDSASPALRFVRQIQELSSEEAARGHPIHLDHAQVLLVQPSTGIVFLKDSSGDLVARAKTETGVTVQPGDIVSVTGVTGLEGASPLIQNASLDILGHADLSSAPPANFHALFSGAYEAQWVSVEGVIKAARLITATVVAGRARKPDPAELVITFASGWDELEVSTDGSSAPQVQKLIDAKLRIRAIVVNEFNNRDLLVGVHLFMPDLSCLKILEQPPGDPFGLPVNSIDSITTLRAQGTRHRVHIRGVITSSWDKKNFSVMDSEHGIWIRTSEPVQASPGDLVDVAGFPQMGDFTAALGESLIRRVGTAVMPAPIRVDAKQALSGTHDAEPIEIDGRLVTISSSDDRSNTLVLADKLVTFSAFFPPNGQANPFRNLQPGSLLRVRGICVIEAGADHVPRDFNVLLRSPADIVVLQSPSPWTSERVLMLAGILLAMVFSVIVWNVVLRRRVQAQTSRIRSELETSSKLRQQAEAAHQEKSQALIGLQSAQQELLAAQEKLRYQATHDFLTGLWNSAAIMDALHTEIERAGRTAVPLGVLLLDLDHFKEVNDTYGHLVGDATLKEIARRIASALRPYDVAGRYGGEEFLVLLPGCGGAETLNVAERIRSAVACSPFRAGQAEFSLTVSIGATIALDWLSHESHFLNQADRALYQAKSSGRNRVILHGETGQEPEPAPRKLAGTK